jgi:hypothetical protein
MFLIVRGVESTVVAPELARMVLSIVLGASVYGAVLFGLWMISGRVAGVESWAEQRATAVVRRVWSGDVSG